MAKERICKEMEGVGGWPIMLVDSIPSLRFLSSLIWSSCLTLDKYELPCRVVIPCSVGWASMVTSTRSHEMDEHNK